MKQLPAHGDLARDSSFAVLLFQGGSPRSFGGQNMVIDLRRHFIYSFHLKTLWILELLLAVRHLRFP